jgi:endonuclease/exonuclease/phosphatase family metal-dependent hydrolase
MKTTHKNAAGIIALVSALLLNVSALPPSINATSSKIELGSFNIQIFGISKMGKPDVVDILLKILSRYDMCLVMEIRDSSETAFPDLVSQLKEYSGKNYAYIVGPRVGRSSSKEQYGFIYRTDRMFVHESWQYPDLADQFERPPFLVTFELIQPTSHSGNFLTIIPTHTKPDNAVDEMNALVDVYDAWEEKSENANAIIMGDFNADCSYVCKSCWSNVDMYNDDRFTWYVDTDVDTTSGNSDCAYDRVVAAGDWLPRATCCATPFDYQVAYGLSDQLTKDVSDHYPIEWTLS